MSTVPPSLLIVDGDLDSSLLLAGEARIRGYRADTAASVPQAVEAVRAELHDAVLVDFAPGADTVFALLSQLKQVAADTEVLVMSDRTSVSSTIQWFDPEAFPVVRKSDTGQLFSTLAQTLERRAIRAQNRRLVWELQTINEIASGISRSLELSEILTGALEGLVRAMDAAAASIRLRDRVTGQFEDSTSVGWEPVHRAWGTLLSGARPSDRVIATREAVIVDDFAAGTGIDPKSLPVRSALSVPMSAGDELIGTLSIVSTRPCRFQLADEQLVRVIAAQIVVAVQNAQLHNTVRQAKKEWEKTFDAISDPIAVFDERGTVLRGNRALAAHLALPVTAIKTLTCGDVGFCGCAGDGHGCAVRRAVGQEPSRSEVALDNGQIFSVTTFPIGPASDGPSVVQVAKNVTEENAGARQVRKMSRELAATNSRLMATLDQLKSTQAQLVQAEKLSAIGQLVAGVAHELNNPLTSVIGYAQLVEEELRSGPSLRPVDEVAHDLRRIAEESERAARIVRNLLTFARRQGSARAPQDIVNICQRVIALREYAFKLSGVALVTRFEAGLPPVLADGGQLQQVLLNLLLNAEQAMRGGGERRLEIAVRHDRRINTVELSVSDSGHGIDPANLSRIFDPFFTTRDVGEGTGLGLSICYGIVRDHGGQISAESRPAEGSTFRVVFPADQGGGQRDVPVLVAHPEPAEREFIVAAMRGWGYRPVAASNSQDATDAWRKTSPLLAIVDRSIVAADAAGWHRRRRQERGRQVPIILTSTAADAPEVGQVRSEEAAVVLAVPVSLAALSTAVQSVTKKEYA